MRPGSCLRLFKRTTGSGSGSDSGYGSGLEAPGSGLGSWAPFQGVQGFRASKPQAVIDKRQ